MGLEAEEDGLLLHATTQTSEPREGGSEIALRIAYVDTGAYPRCGALLLPCEGAGPTAERLAALSERFQDAAPLTTVLAKVCSSPCCLV